LKLHFKTKNSKEHCLKLKKQINHENDKYLTRGIHKLSCHDCGKAYAGQTGSSFTKRFYVHHLSCRNNNTTAKFAQHLLEYSHYFGNMEITKQALYFNKNSTYIKETTEDNQLNERHSIQPNKIFEAVVEGEVYDKHTTHPPILPQDKLQHEHSWFPTTTGNRYAQGHLMILHEVNLMVTKWKW